MPCIFHIDMDAFFASVEVVRNPFLKGKPVIVGGRPDSRGVVSTCSYEARGFGVRSAMSLAEAYRRCPHGVFLDGDFALYREFSHRIIDVFCSYTPYVEVISIDEAYLDMTQPAVMTPAKTLGSLIKTDILETTQLTCSVGIAASKLVAKVASSSCKPNGLLQILEGSEAAFLSPMPIQALPGIGPKTQQSLNREGVKTVSDLQEFSLEQLTDMCGSWGYYYYHACRGSDDRPVYWEESSPKSIGAETTFDKDLVEADVLVEKLKDLLSKAHKRMRKHKMRTKRISLKLRDSSFKTVSRSLTLPAHTNDIDALQHAALGLFYRNYSGLPPLRLIGISLEQLTDSYWQPTFWD